MAKNKKKVINLSNQNICFSEKERHFKINSFNPNSMEVEVSVSEDGKKNKKSDEASFRSFTKRNKEAY